MKKLKASLKIAVPLYVGERPYGYMGDSSEYAPGGAKVDFELKLMAYVPERLQNGGNKKPAIYTYSAPAKLTKLVKSWVIEGQLQNRYKSRLNFLFFY